MNVKILSESVPRTFWDGDKHNWVISVWNIDFRQETGAPSTADSYPPIGIKLNPRKNMYMCTVHKETFIHITTINSNFGCACSAENIVIVRNWVLAKKALPKQKNAVGIHSLLMSNDRFFQRCQKTLGTWKTFETCEYLEVSWEQLDFHYSSFSAESHCCFQAHIVWHAVWTDPKQVERT